MKKSLSMLVGVALTAGTVLAQQTVNSVNAVGFVKLSVPAGKFVLASTPFADFSPSIDEMFRGQLTGTDDPATADRVLVYDSVAQMYRIYWKANNTGDPAYDGHMLDEDLNIVTNVYLFPGDGFWIHSRASSNQTVIFKGEVPNTSKATNTVYQGFTMIGFPFAAGQTLGSNTELYASGATGTDDPATADRVLFYDTVSGAYKINWLADHTGDPAYDGKWLDEDLNISASRFDLGTGAFYHNRGASSFSWVESRPYPSVSQ